ncbi:MAG: hypothetical protein ACUVWX_04960 [Kiritimatiellia bacterium]
MLFLCVFTTGLPAAAWDRTRISSPERIVAQKLREIVVPEIECRQADVRVVLQLLAELGREFDSEKRGVNIVSSLGSAIPREAGTTAPPTELLERVDTVPLITFSARQISLEEALKIVCQLAGLKYRIEGNVVLVVPQNAPDGPIVIRWYDVLPVIEEKVRSIQADRRRIP